MHAPRTPWFRAGAAALLLLTLSACTRSADTVMTPLPSAPPPTATSVATTPTVTATKSATATEALQSTATALPSPTETVQVETATATKAVVAGESACGKALPSRLKINGYAYVNPDPPLPNNLRREAGPNNELVGVLQPGQAMKVLDGPKCVDGWLWWDVNALDSDVNGWTPEGDEQTYWLVPCVSEEECGSQ